jgi:hypothetical protein
LFAFPNPIDEVVKVPVKTLQEISLHHADYGGQGDRQSIGIEICEFRDRVR